MMTTSEIINEAVSAKTELAILEKDQKNEALLAMADALISDTNLILEANKADVEAARGTISEVMIDRLALNEDRIYAMAEGIRNVAKLPDPVGKTISEKRTEDGLLLTKVSVPIGVVAIIYESRPNVTSDAAALCLKSGNVCVLRSGKEAYRTSKAVVDAMKKGLAKVGLPKTCINIIEDTSRESATELMKAHGKIDLLIPRGGAGLIRACVEQATVPCIETGTGICSVYVDKTADLKKAAKIVENAKTQRPSVCNAEEQLLVHADVAKEFLPMVENLLVRARVEKGLVPVEFRLDSRAREIIGGKAATTEDFDTEFLDYILAVKVVSGIEEAVTHIAKHSTHHSEAIITQDSEAASYFASRVDSAAIYVNASTRFTDGGMFGLGCEMGISTQKLHARGPMGLEELTSYKYVVVGNGQVRE